MERLLSYCKRLRQERQERQEQPVGAHRNHAQPGLCGVQTNAMGSKLESGWTTEREASKHGTVALNDHYKTIQNSALTAATVCYDNADPQQTAFRTVEAVRGAEIGLRSFLELRFCGYSERRNNTQPCTTSQVQSPF